MREETEAKTYTKETWTTSKEVKERPLHPQRKQGPIYSYQKHGILIINKRKQGNSLVRYKNASKDVSSICDPSVIAEVFNN